MLLAMVADPLTVKLDDAVASEELFVILLPAAIVKVLIVSAFCKSSTALLFMVKLLVSPPNLPV